MKRTDTTHRWLAAAAMALWVGATAPATAEDHEEELELDVAEIFFELNDTDGDLGIHALIDGEPWKRLVMEDPNERRLLDVRVKSRLRRQGLTELFFESAEPVFDELPPEVFFARFPAGTYEVEGLTLDGLELEGETELTHVLPAPPGDVTVNGIPARPLDDSDCDEEDPPVVSGDVEIEWDAVTESHPELGAFADEIELLRYRVVAEYEDEDEQVFVSNTDLQPDDETDRYSVVIPAGFFVEGEVKFEVLAREASYNQTAVESCPFEYEE